MQTFLPYADLLESVYCLDYRRLGKQRVEGMQLINTLAGRSLGWANHPACKMWVGYEECLKAYTNLCILEWIVRGYNNSMALYTIGTDIKYPPWFGEAKFHASHRSNLLRKDAKYYGQYNWKEDSTLPYIWPVLK